MKRYIETLKEKPENHRKKFACAVSGLLTLFIFAIWSLVTFGGVSSDQVVRDGGADGVIELTETDSVRSNTANAIYAVKNNFANIKHLLLGTYGE